MTTTTIGDLAQSYLLRRQNTDLKSRLNTLVEELSSGRTADIARHLSGSYSYLADVERNLSLLDGYNSATSEAFYGCPRESSPNDASSFGARSNSLINAMTRSSIPSSGRSYSASAIPIRRTMS